MGTEQRKIEILAAVSRRHSPLDREHDKLWKELATRVKFIVEDKKYEPIIAFCSYVDEG